MTSRRFTLDGKPYQPTPDLDAKPPVEDVQALNVEDEERAEMASDDVYSAEDAFRPRPPPADDELEGEEDEP